MTISPESADHLLKLLFWALGGTTTVAGSWIASKIRAYDDNRKAHHDELKEQVLRPLLKALEEDFSPLLDRLKSALASRWAELATIQGPSVTDPQNRWTLLTEALNPWDSFRGAVDGVLYRDAETNHYPELLAAAAEFERGWDGHAEQIRQWVESMALELETRSGIPTLEHGNVRQVFANYNGLAQFVYGRVYGLQVGQLTKERSPFDVVAGPPEQVVLVTIKHGPEDLAKAPAGQIDQLVETLNLLIAQNQSNGQLLKSASEHLATILQDLSDDVRLALASKKLKHRCQLVVFF